MDPPIDGTAVSTTYKLEGYIYSKPFSQQGRRRPRPKVWAKEFQLSLLGLVTGSRPQTPSGCRNVAGTCITLFIQGLGAYPREPTQTSRDYTGRSGLLGDY